MSDLGALPGTAYRRLSVTTFVLTLLLIAVGGIVRVSDSGLGCGAAGSGLHGWPLCGGRVLPILNANQIVEYSHRALASLVGLLILALVFWAWRRYRSNKTLVWLSTAAVVLVIGEGVLGGATVENDLSPWLVATHLGISMLILGALLGIVLACSARAAVPLLPKATRVLAVVASFFTWCTIVIGGYVAGTEKYGSLSGEIDGGAHLACGREFPSCNGGLFPFGQSQSIDLQLTHRLFMYLTVIAVVLLVGRVLSGATVARTRNLAIGALVVLGSQVLLGAMNVWFGEHRGLILGHLMLGTILWLVLLALTLELLPWAKSEPIGKNIR